jgi:hypothetical protein
LTNKNTAGDNPVTWSYGALAGLHNAYLNGVGSIPIVGFDPVTKTDPRRDSGSFGGVPEQNSSTTAPLLMQTSNGAALGAGPTGSFNLSLRLQPDFGSAGGSVTDDASDTLGPAAAASVPGLNIVDVIPLSDSAETNQNSEPSLAVDPADPTKIIVGAFYTVPGAAYFKSTDGGATWADDALLTSYDKTLAWTQDGSTCLTASLNDSQNIYLYSGSTSTNFSTPFNAVSGNGYNIDQPWLRTGSANHLYLTLIISDSSQRPRSWVFPQMEARI